MEDAEKPVYVSTEERRQAQKQEILRTQSAIQAESRRYSNTSGEAKPWIADDGRSVTWSMTRIRVAKVIRLQQFEALMGCIIVFNLILIIIETDREAQCFPPEPSWAHDKDLCPHRTDKVPWIKYTNLALLIIYTVEAMVRIYVDRIAYFQIKWNILDFSVVLVGWVSEALGGIISLAFLRIFRIARLSRAFRLFLSIRELYMLVTGLGSSMRAIFFGMILLFGMLTVWAIILVDFIHPVNASLTYAGCERCSRGFASVSDSVVTLFQQIVAGDSWGLISIPVMEKEPLTAIVMIAILISVSLGVMNLILAVIVESAAEAREQDLEQKTKQKLKEREYKKIELLKLCTDLDKDYSDTISLEEMEKAFEHSAKFRSVMAVLEVTREEISAVFEVLDADGSGEVDYREFVDRLYALRTCDIRLQLAQIQQQMSKQYVINQERHQAHEMKLERQLQMLQSIDSKLVQLSCRNGFAKPGNMAEANGGYLSAQAESGPPNCAEKAKPSSDRGALLKKAISLSMPSGDDYTPELIKGAEAGLTSQRGCRDGNSPYLPPAPSSIACEDNPQLEFNPSLPVNSSLPDMSEVSSGLGQLQLHMDKLAELKADIVTKAAEQARTLRRQSSILNSVHASVLQGSIANSNAGNFGETLLELQRHVQQRLTSVLRNSNAVSEEEGLDLARSATLIEDLTRHVQMRQTFAG